MPSSTKAINFARIVHRLMTDARGWRIDLLKQELEIADRTWRKYRQDLQDYFEPFWDERGVSMVEEVEVGEHRYVRLRRPMDSVGPSDAGAFRARLAAMHLARRMFGYLEQTSIGDQLRSLIQSLRGLLSGHGRRQSLPEPRRPQAPRHRGRLQGLR